MARPSNTAKLVITSIIISLIVLAVFVLIFISYIVPAYQITEEQIYSVLVKLFPVLIGLVLIQIGVMAGRRGEPDYSETIDKLAPNAYDSPLYTSPKDDPMARGKVDASALSTGTEEGAKVVERIVEKEVPVEVVKEVPVEVIKTVEVPVEIIREVQVPVEVVKEVTVEKEVPVEVIKEVVVEKQVPVEVVKEVPVEIIKEVQVPVEVEKAVEKAPELLGFHDVLKTEADDAIKGCYDLSIVAVKERDGITEGLLRMVLRPHSERMDGSMLSFRFTARKRRNGPQRTWSHAASHRLQAGASTERHFSGKHLSSDAEPPLAGGFLWHLWKIPS